MNRELLERVCNAPGIPGLEDAVQRIATEVLTGCCDEGRRDHMGNVIAPARMPCPSPQPEPPSSAGRVPSPDSRADAA